MYPQDDELGLTQDEPIPEEFALQPDEMLSDEVDGQILPIGDETNSFTEIPAPEEPVIPDFVVDALKSAIEDYDRIEQPVRDRMIRYWKKLELFWKGIQNIYWDWNAKDWRRAEQTSAVGREANEELDFYYQDKIINICRAHGESVISALSQDIPAVIFPPDDAENVDDLQTSKGYTKAAELLQKCNNAELLMMNAIYVLWNQGLVAAYNYNCADFEFGSYFEPVYENEEVIVDEYSCPECGAQAADPSTPCPYCAENGIENMPIPIGQHTETRQVYSYDEEKPKQREKIELYGPLNVKIPHYVTNPKHTPYVMLDTECNVDYIRHMFPDIDVSTEIDSEKYERWARSSSDYQGEDIIDLVTLRRVWLRSWTFCRFKKDKPEVYDWLMANVPDGCKITLVNDKVARVESEDLDEHWTFTQNPLASHIHAEPLGAPLIPIQEMRNELVVLKLQTVEYGIPETFADPQVLDFATYNKHEAGPGSIIPAKAPAGGTLDSGFATLKTATFPKEANDFQQSLDSDGQFVTGAFPSIYGGSMPSASKTAAEYQMSRNQALQRLQTTWKLLSHFWAKVMDKSVRSFVSHMTQDERFTEKQGKSYINVYIRQNEMQGRVGTAEPELAQTFPMSWMQKKDLLVQMMQLNNEYINQALFHPQNTGLLAEYLGFRDFYIPGDDARTKQLLEIQDLLNNEPIENPEAMATQENPDLPPMEGQAAPQPFIPTVQVDPEIDDHQVEFDTCVAWMNSEIGLDAKETNPAGFMNVRMHALQHLQFVQMMQQQQAEAEAEMEQQNKKNKDGGNKNPEGLES